MGVKEEVYIGHAHSMVTAMAKHIHLYPTTTSATPVAN